MSQDFETHREADLRPLSDWPERGLPAHPVRGRQSLGAAADRTPAYEPDSFASAQDWLRTAACRLADLETEELVGAVARVEWAYRRFPALELDCPRASLVEALQSAAGTLPDDHAIPLLMACAVLDSAASSAAVAILLDRMARAGHGGAIRDVVAILARQRKLMPDEITPALEELSRQGQTSTALAVISEAFGHVDADATAAVAELGAALKRILAAEIGREVDPTELATTILAARDRVRLPRPAPGSKHRLSQLLATAERVAAKLPQPAREAGVTEPPALQSPAIETGGLTADWLPAMQVGDAGERHERGVSAKPGCSGHLLFGPYLKLGTGDYRVRVCCSTGQPERTVPPEGPPEGPLVAIEAVSDYGKTYLDQRELQIEDCGRPEHHLRFSIGSRLSPPIEVRVWTSGLVALTVSSVIVERVEASSSGEIASTELHGAGTPSPE